MNYPMIKKIIGVMLIMFAVTLLIPIFTSLIYFDNNHWTFIFSMSLLLFVGSILYFPNQEMKSSDIKAKEGFLIVVLFWMILSLFGSIPFALDRDLSLNFVDSFLNLFLDGLQQGQRSSRI